MRATHRQSKHSSGLMGDLTDRFRLTSHEPNVARNEEAMGKNVLKLMQVPDRLSSATNELGSRGENLSRNFSLETCSWAFRQRV